MPTSPQAVTHAQNIRYDKTAEALYIIDQSLLPEEEREIRLQTAEEMVEAMYQNVLAWEDVLYVANQVQGIIPAAGARPDSYRYPMSVRQNIRYMRMFAGAFMYAAGNHVGVGWGSTTGLVCGRPVSVTGQNAANGLFGWGIAHEIGHNMDKLGQAEITNNLYSLMVQTFDGKNKPKGLPGSQTKD